VAVARLPCTPVDTGDWDPVTRTRFVGLAVTTVLLSTALTGGVLGGIDLYLHRRHDVNIWGYRGPILGRKQPDERRIAVVGGSTAWGYGVPWIGSFPARAEQALNAIARDAGRGPVRVANLAFNNEGAYSFQFTLRDYAYLDYDVALLYTGYNDLHSDTWGGNTQVIRRQSPIFRLTGYWPLIPVILPHRFPILQFLQRGGGRRAEFQPDLATQGPTAGNEIRRALKEQLGALSERPGGDSLESPQACSGRWVGYCGLVEAAIREAIARGERVLVVTEPYIADRHISQQRALAGMLRQRFGGDPRVHYANLGRLIDLRDPGLSFDGMHLTARGNVRVAEALVPQLMEVLP
jgi:hypothetical protein